MDKKEILKAMIFDEDEEFRKLISKAKNIVKVKKNGEPVILAVKGNLTKGEIIACYLLGKYFSKELGLSETVSATNEEISKATGIKKTVVGARLGDLKKDSLVEVVGRGEHKISFVNLEEFLDKILAKMKT
jgi:hypothetical protein